MSDFHQYKPTQPASLQTIDQIMPQTNRSEATEMAVKGADVAQNPFKEEKKEENEQHIKRLRGGCDPVYISTLSKH